MKDAIIIGIAGGTGCGKSTLINKIKDEFNDDICILSHDFYYKQRNDIPFEERKKINYDHPNAFDTDLFLRDLRSLKAKVIVVEGILIFENAELRDLCDIKVFIDTDADVRIIRRILRDVQERGRMLDNIVDQYLTTVKPMHEMFVEPSKKYADIIIPEGGFNQVAFEMLAYRIHALLRDHKEQ